MIETTLERIVLDETMRDGDWVGTKEEKIARRAALAALKLLWAEVDRRPVSRISMENISPFSI